VADFIQMAKQASGKMTFGTGGNGSPQHMAMALFAAQAGLTLTHVPYKGATQAAIGVAGKEVEAAFQGIATVHPLVKAGKLKLIAVSTPKRMAQFPETPTVSESGLRGFEFNSWFAMMAPAGTAKAITQRLSQEVGKALGDASTRDQLLAQGLTPRGSTPEELASALKSQLARYEALIRQAGITAD
jgi:tripartite-type tricarboxylate transporter receptor subunit TctC